MCRLRMSHLTAYVLIAFVLVAILGMIAMQSGKGIVASDNQRLREEIEVLEQGILEYEDRIANLGTDESVEQLARERLHWVYDQEIVYIDAGNR